VQLDIIKTRVESSARPWSQRLKLRYDEPLSNLVFEIHLRRYNEDKDEGGMHSADDWLHEVGRCRLTLSNPR